MGVSIDTIRRDLKKLEEEGKLTCIRGGACSSEEELQYSPFFGRQIINEDLKREAAKKATSLIHSGNIIALNAGTTNSILAEELVKLKKQITVVTNNLSALSILTGSEYIQIVVPSGIVDKEELALYGCNCVEEISSYSFDLSFLAINAVHPIYGFSDFRFQDEFPDNTRRRCRSPRRFAGYPVPVPLHGGRARGFGHCPSGQASDRRAAP